MEQIKMFIHLFSDILSNQMGELEASAQVVSNKHHKVSCHTFTHLQYIDAIDHE